MSGSTGILATPTIPQPRVSGDVVGLVLQNPGGSALGAREITFGQTFAPGAVPAGRQLLATIDGQQIPVQMDVKTTNADGSVCTAVLTLMQPALAADSSANVMLSLAPPDAKLSPALDLAQAVSGGYNVAVNLTEHNAGGASTPYSFNVGALLLQALVNGTATFWLHGPQATEASFSVPVNGSLRLVFNVTAYADGSFATDVQFNNDMAMQPVGGTVNYDAGISQNGQIVSQKTNLAQYQYQDWHQIVYSNGAPAVNVQHDIAALEKTGVVQNYDLTTGVSELLISQEQTIMSDAGWDTPLSANGVTQYMPDVGGRADIGPTTKYATAWLMSQDQTAAQMALGWADAAGAVPWHFYDPSEGSYIKVTAIPDIWTDGRGGPSSGTTGLTQQNVGAGGGSALTGSISGTTLTVTAAAWPPLIPGMALSGAGIPPGTVVVSNGTGTGGTGTYILSNPASVAGEAIAYGSGWTPDEAHQPDLSFDAYLMTGNAYYLDQLNAQASYSETDFWPADTSWGARNNEQGLVADSANQVRGIAWDLREIDEAAWANPDGSPEKAYFTQMENNNWSWLVSQLPTWTAKQGQAHGWIPGNYGNPGAQAPWQQDFFVSTAVQAAEMGNKDAATVVKWMDNFIAGSFLAAPQGFSPYDGFAYNLSLIDSSGAPYTSWSAVEQATEAAGRSNNGTMGPGGYYAANALMALAGDITVTASPLAIKAYGWLYATSYSTGWITQAGYAGTSGSGDGGSDLTFNIVPRLPDGNSLTNGDVHVFNSATAGTLAASGADQLIYDLGAANDTIVGGSGTNILFAGSGNDLLLANGTTNYLFGGSGADTLVGGAGTNYLDASGVSTVIGASASGPTTFSLAAAISASDTIADFKPGTDHLAITDSSGHLLSAAQIKALIAGATADAAGDAVLTLSPIHSTTLDGISVGSLVPSMFVAGIGSTDPATGTIGGAVFGDLNNDGIWESGEAGLAGVSVDLLAAGTIAATTTTAPDGSYRFGSLAVGAYSLEFSAPHGEDFSPQGNSATLPNSIVNPSGISPTITLASGGLAGAEDAGLFTPGTISGAAFNDLNGDGIWQSGESPAAGVAVELLAGGVVRATTTTDSHGNYSFGQLAAGTYAVEFIAPSGETFAPHGANTTLPNSIINGSGISPAITLTGGGFALAVDGGLIARGVISGAAFDDFNGDGVWQSGESPAAGVTVELLSGGVVRAATTTDSSGSYSFSNLNPGGYTLQFVAPSGQVFSPRGASSVLPDSLVNSSGALNLTLGSGQIASAKDVGLRTPPQAIVIGTSGTTLQGGTRLLTLIDSVGGNSIIGGSGGVDLFASAGADTVSTATGASDRLTFSTGGALRGAALVESNGADTVSAIGRTVDVFANGASMLVTETKATINMTETAGGQYATATVTGGAATLSGGLGQNSITIVAAKGAKVTLGTSNTGLASPMVAATSQTIPQGSTTRGLSVTAGSGNITLNGGNNGEIIQFGAGNATVHGGTAPNLYEFAAGKGGGLDVITGFRPGIDQLQFQGYGHVKIPPIGQSGHATIQLSDGTTVKLYAHP